eukprot:6133368-Alexandrium_andersonii.AAC.1
MCGKLHSAHACAEGWVGGLAQGGVCCAPRRKHTCVLTHGHECAHTLVLAHMPSRLGLSARPLSRFHPSAAYLAAGPFVP